MECHGSTFPNCNCLPAGFQEEVRETLQSETHRINTDTNIYLQDKTENASKVKEAYSKAQNGIVHIIDKVLLPQSVLDELFPKPSFCQLIAGDENLELFKLAIIKADMVSAFDGEGPLTVFAPNSDAVQLLFDYPVAEYNDFNNPQEIQVLREIEYVPIW
nr:fasciclin domain-containing protein [Arenibacter sp. F20364]